MAKIYEIFGADAHTMTKALMETMGLTMDKAMEALKVPEKKRAYYAKKVQG